RPHHRSRLYRYGTDSEEPARDRSGSSRAALLRSAQPWRRGLLPRLYPELALPRNQLQRRSNPRKERTEDSPQRRSNPASRTLTARPRRRTGTVTTEEGARKARQRSPSPGTNLNPTRRKIDATKP